MCYHEDNYFKKSFQESFEVWFYKYTGDTICERLNKNCSGLKYELEMAIKKNHINKMKNMELPKDEIDELIKQYYCHKIYSSMIQKDVQNQKDSMNLFDNINFFEHYIETVLSEIENEIHKNNVNFEMLALLEAAKKFNIGKFDKVEFKLIRNK